MLDIVLYAFAAILVFWTLATVLKPAPPESPDSSGASPARGNGSEATR